ncbi:MAG: methionyl-tRNA formyltransferase [Devosia indica]
MRIGFVTCVELGLACLEEIEGLGGRLNLLVTLDDSVARRKSGRIFLDHYAARNSTPLVKTNSINDPGCVATLKKADLDYLLVIGWSQILKPEVIRTVRRGIYGMHPTLLPVGRGRAPIPWTILKDLTETGVTAFEIGEGVDNGAIVGQVGFAVATDETATSLYAKSVGAHRQLMRELWPRLCQGFVQSTPQDESRATHWDARTPQDGEILPHMSVAEVDRLVRASTRPYPGAFVVIEGVKYLVWAGSLSSTTPDNELAIACQDGLFFAQEFEVETSI